MTKLAILEKNFGLSPLKDLALRVNLNKSFHLSGTWKTLTGMKGFGCVDIKISSST